MYQNHRDDFTSFLPVFVFPNTSASQGVSSYMNRTIKKSSKTIVLHSITAKPEYKKGVKTTRQKNFYNKKEYNKWIDDAYLLMAKAYLVNGDLVNANNALRFIIKEYKGENSYTEAQIWLAKKLILENEYTESLEILTNLSNDKKFPKKHTSLLNAVFAEYYISKEAYFDAIPKLETAIKFNHTKFEKIRYKFLLAQLYQKTGDFKNARKKYLEVIKMNPPYEMAFNARINLASVFEKGYGSSDEIRKKLYQMLKDEKNTEYQDQIYYALANIDIAEGKKEDALANYNRSIRKSTNNQRQKARSYLAIADIKYYDKDYLAAQAYYDSALVNIDETFPNYEQINNRSRGLTNLAKCLNTVSFEDSVQFVAKMSENERNIFIDKLIAKVREQEAEEQRKMNEEANMQQENMIAYSNYQSGRGINTETAGDKWYFYSPSAKSYGESEFKLKWGNRKLEDNWRRSNKRSVLSETGEATEDTSIVENDAEAKKRKLSNKTREFYLVDLPLTDSAMAASHEKIRKNIIKAAEIYRDDLREYQLSANQYNEILKRYPDHDDAAQAMYQLYLLYMQMNNTNTANEYKNKLINKFPESIYAKMLANPKFVKELEEKERQIEKIYSDAYNEYNAGNYLEAQRLCENGIKIFPNNNLKVKFLLLNSLSKGKSFGLDSLRQNLLYIIRNYPKSEESALSKDIIASIDKERPEIKVAQEKEEAKILFKFPSETEKHLFVAIIQVDKGNINQLKFNLINFNLDFYPKIELSVTSEPYADKAQMIIVSEFKTISEAINYYSTAKNQESVWKDVGNVRAFFVISEENLKVLKTYSNEELYVNYFKDNYNVK